MRRIPRLSLIPLVLLILLGLTVAAGAATVKAKPGTQRASAAAGGFTLAPLNPQFLRYQAKVPLGGPPSVDSGFGLGKRPAPMDLSYATGLLARHARGVYPATYDLRALGRVTSVKDQNPFGTCWAFAATGSLESALMPGENNDFSEDNMALNSGFDLDPYNGGGNIWMSTAYLARWGGPVNESDDAYGDGFTPPDLTLRKHVQDVSWIPARATSTDNDNLKWAVTTYGGTDVSMYFSSSPSAYKKATHAYYIKGGGYSNHEVLVVGWNDNYAASNFATKPPGNGAFIVKNSWGTSWGDSGYFYVSYYDSVFGKDDPMAVYNGAQATTNYSRVYQYDPLGWVDSVGSTSASDTGWIANVYRAQATASLSAVGFYAAAMNTSYEVWAGSSLATLSLLTSGTLATMGYHTVALPVPVALTGGQPFVVAAKLTTPGYDYPMPVEYPTSGYSGNATAEPGQSYLSPDGASWIDASTWLTDTNVCLKAYTTGDPAPSDDDFPGLPLPGSPTSATLDAGSDTNDVFSVDLNVGDTLQASISAGAGTNFDLYLFPPSQGTLAGHSGWVAAANSSSYPDGFTYAATERGTFYLDAFASSGSGSYTITYTVTPLLTRDDIPGMAIPPSPFSDSLARGSDDNDVFSIHLDSRQTLHASVTGAAATDFDLYLFPPGTVSISSGNWIARAYGTRYPDSFNCRATKSGTYYLDARAYSGAGAYTITYSITSPAPDDDVPGVALPASPFSDSLDSALDVDDVFQLPLDAGQRISASISGPSGTNFDLLLYRPGTITVVDAPGWIAGAGSNHYPDKFSYTATTGGIYYLDAYGYRGAGHYTVAYKIVTLPATTALATVTVQRGKSAAFPFMVTAVTPTAKVTIKISKGAKLMRTLVVGGRPTSIPQTYTWKCNLPAGTYKWKVYATDRAGNTQWKVGSETLHVT